MDSKIALPSFLKILTSNNIPAIKSMTIAKKIYKEYNTPAQLAQLTDFKLKAAGVDDKEERKLVIAALRKAGYISAPARNKKDTLSLDASPGPSSSSASETTRKKRKRVTQSKNEFLPDAPVDEGSSLVFNEVLDESILQSKAAVVNRAPLMTAWATIVAERMGFQREEALSIASSYTEMNAISKGVSLGIYKDGEQNGLEATKGGPQPYVELMGRRPLYQIQNDRWRALHNSKPMQPSAAFSYISRSLRQTMPFIIGALRLLADSFTPQEINSRAWGLYVQFRPPAEGWGERSEVRCSTILALRKPANDILPEQGVKESVKTDEPKLSDLVKYEPVVSDGRETKRFRTGMTFEQYEAALDEDHTFDNVYLDV
ncbi:hypothetical protein GYMLUDRAFT_154641 [Collybiopsis luxurians FD-317 M1]|nr:hypothetical protein GYMLUDRAFT_154641 [Collybiopsis luxurians FD-317 M1]